MVPGSLAGLSTWKKPPWNTMVSGSRGGASRGRETPSPPSLPAACEASAACFLAFMAALAAARRDLPAAPPPAGLGAVAGAFSEGLMHGYGLYTWSDGVKYEGEFVANVPAGRGTYAWPDGSSYEGDVHNAIRHGIGTHRCADTPVWYRGQWHRGKRQGKGVMYYNQDQTSWYDGDWLDNKREGWGVRRYGRQRPGRNTHVGVTMKEKAGQSDQGYPSGNFYEGEWRDNARHGQGTLRWVTLGQQHAGTWRNGVQVGIKERFPSKPADENHHEGTHTWLVSRVSGSQYPQRNQYQGEFVLGARHGPGSFRYASGERYQGDWKNNEKHGQGKFTFTNGRSIEREFVDDHMVEVPQAGLGGPTSRNPHHRTPRGELHEEPVGLGILLTMTTIVWESSSCGRAAGETEDGFSF
ncbi:hypothetical protein CRUP_024740 [Coryphaenoides rupestris]|nr:hypothetical protein CRUP_024740 [Coryphaenoides rupestris]